jgi:HEAT repeat protein
LNALEHGKEVQRRNVAELLGYIGGRDASRGLIYALSDRNAEVRAEAARALGRIGDPAAVLHLRKLWRREDDPTVRRQASLAITQLLTGNW